MYSQQKAQQDAEAREEPAEDAMFADAFKKLIDEQLAMVEKSGVAGGDYYDKVVIAKGEKQFRSKVDPRP